MGNEHDASQARVSNWTLATATRPGERTPVAVGPRTNT
jgi:hypothetical protein